VRGKRRSIDARAAVYYSDRSQIPHPYHHHHMQPMPYIITLLIPPKTHNQYWWATNENASQRVRVSQCSSQLARVFDSVLPHAFERNNMRRSNRTTSLAFCMTRGSSRRFSPTTTLPMFLSGDEERYRLFSLSKWGVSRDGEADVLAAAAAIDAGFSLRGPSLCRSPLSAVPVCARLYYTHTQLLLRR
jgi:hypothetical protein